MGDAAVSAVVREILAVTPAGCSWLLPVTDGDGTVVDLTVGAASGRVFDIYGRGEDRVDARLSVLYPSMVGGPLWQIYLDVLRTGEPGELPGFRYEEKRSGIVAHSLFDVRVHPLLGGLLVWWQRVDESQRRLEFTELLGNLGWSEYDLVSGVMQWSPGMYRIFGRDPALGPLSRVAQAAAMHPDDRGISETAWQTLDAGAPTDVTVRFRIDGTVKHLRVLADAVIDATGAALKINSLVQDVTARESSRSAIEQLSDRLQAREMTALAEHRLAGQLQNLIQPVPPEPLELPGLHVAVGYLPSESVARVGGDWYHAQTLADGRVLLAVGDVAGHGMNAASGMAHLRFGLIAWLSAGIHEPARLLSNLNKLCTDLRITGTAVIGVYDPGTCRLTWARAGHTPPLLARAGSAHPLNPPTGMLLGADPGARYTRRTPRLSGDDLLLFYTDGLVERRAAGNEPLLTEVKTLLGTASAQLTPRTLTTVAAALSRPSPEDDSCFLAVRVL